MILLYTCSPIFQEYLGNPVNISVSSSIEYPFWKKKKSLGYFSFGGESEKCTRIPGDEIYILLPAHALQVKNPWLSLPSSFSNVSFWLVAALAVAFRSCPSLSMSLILCGAQYWAHCSRLYVQSTGWKGIPNQQCPAAGLHSAPTSSPNLKDWSKVCCSSWFPVSPFDSSSRASSSNELKFSLG